MKAVHLLSSTLINSLSWNRFPNKGIFLSGSGLSLALINDSGEIFNQAAESHSEFISPFSDNVFSESYFRIRADN